HQPYRETERGQGDQGFAGLNAGRTGSRKPAARHSVPGSQQGSPAMPGPLPSFPTAVVGSLPRPRYVKDLLAAGSRTGAGSPDPAWLRRMDDAVRFAIGMQEQAGIDIISDGEWRRETYVD